MLPPSAAQFGDAASVFTVEMLLPSQLGARGQIDGAAGGASAWPSWNSRRSTSSAQARAKASGRRSSEFAITRARSSWVASDDTAWEYSFVNVCLALDLEPACVRRALQGASTAPDGLPVQSVA